MCYTTRVFLRLRGPCRLPLTTEHNRDILSLTRQGYTNAEIAETMGISVSSVESAKTRAFRAVITEHEVTECIRVEQDRYEELHKKWYEAALAGNKDAADMILKISDRRSKLLGLNAPEKRINENRNVNLVELLKYANEHEEELREGSGGEAPVTLEGQSVPIRDGSAGSDTGGMAG